MHVRAETFVQGEPQKMCLTATNDVITFYVNGQPIASQAPVGSVALVGGGKVQIGRDPECSRRCEREIGNLDATVEDYTIWSKALTTEQVADFTNGMCINNAELTLEQVRFGLVTYHVLTYSLNQGCCRNKQRQEKRGVRLAR